MIDELGRIGQPKDRSYIARLKRDPRLHAMLQGWIAQATTIALEQQRGNDRIYPEHLASEAAHEALTLALSFILDHDGEYLAVCEERDQYAKHAIAVTNLRPSSLFVSEPTTGDAQRDS